MKTYEVKLTDRAEQNWREAYEWYAGQSVEAASRWYDAVFAALRSLEHNPDRWPLAGESPDFPIELRQLNFGSGRRTTHRVIFAIRPDWVVVYAVRHLAQRDIDLNALLS